MLFTPRYEPCTECGESLAAEAKSEHVCSPERQVEFETFQAQQQATEDVADQFAHWLASPTSAFETWRAARTVRRRPPRATS